MEEEQAQQPETKNSNSIMLIGGIVLAVIVIAGFLFVRGNSQKPSVASVSISSAPTQENQRPTNVESLNPTEIQTNNSEVSNGETKVINIDAGSYYYNPKEIRVKKGEKVQIVMTARDMQHDFNIDELNVKMPITISGETNSVTFTADRVGEFEYYCSVGNHRQLGQTGTLFVEE